MNASLFGTHVAAEPQNDFKPFAVGEKANVIEQSEYEKAAFLKDGFREGIARSSEINKAIRQGSSIATALARFAAAKTGEDILDNGDIDLLSRQIETAIGSVSSLLLAKAQGIPDAIVAGFTPAVRELKDGLLVHVRAEGANTATGPTFDADGTGARTIVKGNNLSLAMGDIAGTGHWLELQYDEALDKWILQNPAKGVTPQSGVPVGTIEYFAMTTPPAGYLKADGAAVGRETYPELFAAIGTTFGEGDGSTTFNLPDLIDRFAQGSSTPGQKIEAGLPNVTGYFSSASSIHDDFSAPFSSEPKAEHFYGGVAGGNGYIVQFDLSTANPIYSASDTVQPPALTLLPCIKAFDAATNSGLIDVTELANEVANKADRNLSNVTNEGKSAVFEYCLPDYTAGVTKNVETEYTAATNGYIYVVAGNDGGVNQLVINDTTMNVSLISGGGFCQTSLLMPVSEGTRYKLIIGNQSGIGGTVYTFYPLEGII